MKTANERLAEARAALGYDRKAEFAEYVGIERSTYDKMEKGPHKPSADNLERIASRCPQLNLTWLLTGKGQMLLTVVNAPQASEPLTSGDATIEYATKLASHELMREVINDQKETIADLRSTVAFLKEELGKFPGSSDAAQSWYPPYAPIVGRRVYAMAG